MKRRTFILSGGLCGGLATVALSQDIFEVFGQLLKQLSLNDPDYQFTEALLDIQNVEKHFEAALAVAPRVVLDSSLSESHIESGKLDEEAVAEQIRDELRNAQKFIRNAIYKINGGLEAGGGDTEVPDVVRKAAENRDWSVTVYADFYMMIQDVLSQLDEIIGGEDLGAVMAEISEFRGRLIEIRTVMTVGA